MIRLTFIITLMAGTLFVSCSKKKNNNPGPQPAPYPIAATYDPNGYYGHNGYFDPNLYPQNQVVFNTQLNCTNTSPIVMNSLGLYCEWLAGDARRDCDINLVKQQFTQYCMHLAYTYNFCVPSSYSAGYAGYVYYSPSIGYKSSRTSYSSSSRRTSTRSARIIRSERVSSSPRVERVRYDDSRVYSRDQRVVVERDPVQRDQVIRPQNTAVSKDNSCIEIRRYDLISPRELAINGISNKNYNDTLSKVCLQNIINSGCSDSRTGTRIKNIPKVDDINSNTFYESAARLLTAAERNNLRCKNKIVKYSDLKDSCYGEVKSCSESHEVTGSSGTLEKVDETMLVDDGKTQLGTHPVQDEAPAKVAEIKNKDFLNKCFNLEELHNRIRDPKNDLVSYSTQYIVKPTIKSINPDTRKEITDAIYGLPFGSTGFSVSGVVTNMKETAIGGIVSQKNDVIVIDGIEGEIINCDAGRMDVVFEKEGREYGFKLSLTDGLGEEGGILVKMGTPSIIDGRDAMILETLSLISWAKRSTIEKIKNSQTKKTHDQTPQNLFQLKARIYNHAKLDEELRSTTRRIELENNTLDLIKK